MSTRVARFTDKTIVTSGDLRTAVSEARERGYSFDDEEAAIGMGCVAARFRDGYGEVVAGIPVTGPTNQMPDANVPEIGRWVFVAAAKAPRMPGASGQMPSSVHS